MLELWLVRHGETLWHGEGRVQGRSDPPLSERGRGQARKLASRLSRIPFSAVYSSDLQRTSETARLALPGAPILVDTRLCELDFGAWEGRLWQEVADNDPDALNAWYTEPYRNSPTGGETYAALCARVAAWLGALPTTGRVVAFTHGGPIRSLLYGLTGVPEGQRWRFDPGPASLTKLVLGEQGVILKTVGDMAHLEAEDIKGENLEKEKTEDTA